MLDQELPYDEQESYSKIYKLFSLKIYGKTARKLSVAMPNIRLPTNFQLNIFIFEAIIKFSFRPILSQKVLTDFSDSRPIFGQNFLTQNQPK